MAGIGLDSSTPVGLQQGGFNGLGANYLISAVGSQYSSVLSAGYHYIAALEYGGTGADCQFSGGTTGQTGLYVQVLG
jgi:hypothetical protein